MVNLQWLGGPADRVADWTPPEGSTLTLGPDQEDHANGRRGRQARFGNTSDDLYV